MAIDKTNLKTQVQERIDGLTGSETLEDLLIISKAAENLNVDRSALDSAIESALGDFDVNTQLRDLLVGGKAADSNKNERLLEYVNLYPGLLNKLGAITDYNSEKFLNPDSVVLLEDLPSETSTILGDTENSLQYQRESVNSALDTITSTNSNEASKYWFLYLGDYVFPRFPRSGSTTYAETLVYSSNKGVSYSSVTIPSLPNHYYDAGITYKGSAYIAGLDDENDTAIVQITTFPSVTAKSICNVTTGNKIFGMAVNPETDRLLVVYATRNYVAALDSFSSYGIGKSTISNSNLSNITVDATNTSLNGKDIQFVGNDTFIALFYDATNSINVLYKSTDDGATWNKLSFSGAGQDISANTNNASIKFNESTGTLIARIDGKIFRSTDLGETFTYITDVGNTGVPALHNSGKIWVTARSNAILISLDDGLTWDSYQDYFPPLSYPLAGVNPHTNVINWILATGADKNRFGSLAIGAVYNAGAQPLKIGG